MTAHTHTTIARRLFVEACARLNNDIAAVRGGAVKLASESATGPHPDQQLLNALACIEERLRLAQSALAHNALTVLTVNEGKS